jgi:hypothetical protein
VGSNVGVGATNALALGDMNGDGYLDVVAGNTFQPNRLYLNNRTATPFANVAGSNITTASNNTYALALGDVDGDGDLDVVAGNFSEANRLYLNNGSATPFVGVTSNTLTADSADTLAIALGDVDGDGDLDIVAANYNQPNRLYLNNGSGSFTGSNLTADSDNTSAIALGDVDGDGDLDVVAGNQFQPNRLYLNNGTAAPFNGVTGSDITADSQFTNAIALGDVDSDGDLDVIGGTSGQPNRLYLNNGTAAPFAGATGNDITTAGQNTYALALGDVDGDGHLDVTEGNLGQPNRLYLAPRLYDTARGVATSVRLSSDASLIGRATLTFTGTLPRNTSVTWWLTSNGGARWFEVRPGVPFDFPTAARGNDLRWRARLGSLSPATSPRIDSLTIVAGLDTDGDGLFDSVDPDDDNDGVLDINDAFPLDPAASIDTDGDGMPDDWNAGATPEQIAASLVVVDTDDDNDGMPDDYELTNGFDPLDPSDAAADADGDGVSNLREFRAGTNPHDAADVPRQVPPAIFLLLGNETA